MINFKKLKNNSLLTLHQLKTVLLILLISGQLLQKMEQVKFQHLQVVWIIINNNLTTLHEHTVLQVLRSNLFQYMDQQLIKDILLLTQHYQIRDLTLKVGNLKTSHKQNINTYLLDKHQQDLLTLLQYVYTLHLLMRTLQKNIQKKWTSNVLLKLTRKTQLLPLVV